MTNGAEQKRFLTQNWEILDLSYLKCKTVRQIAGRTGKDESDVRLVVSKAWAMGITYGDVHDYMQRI